MVHGAIVCLVYVYVYSFPLKASVGPASHTGIHTRVYADTHSVHAPLYKTQSRLCICFWDAEVQDASLM